jgi:hypothetical protein
MNDGERSNEIIDILTERERLRAELAKIGAETNDQLKSEKAIAAVHRFLINIDIGAELLFPITSIVGRLLDDRRRRKPDRLRLAAYAAAIDVLRQHGSPMQTAIEDVSKAADVDPAVLKEFRQQMGRGLARAEGVKQYSKFLAQYRERSALSADPKQMTLETVRWLSGKMRRD